MSSLLWFFSNKDSLLISIIYEVAQCIAIVTTEIIAWSRTKLCLCTDPQCWKNLFWLLKPSHSFSCMLLLCLPDHSSLIFCLDILFFSYQYNTTSTLVPAKKSIIPSWLCRKRKGREAHESSALKNLISTYIGKP